MAFFFCATANKIAGIKYASDLPTPVPASTARCSRFCNARATATAISCCCGRNSKLFALDRIPVGEKISSTCETKSSPPRLDVRWRKSFQRLRCSKSLSKPKFFPARAKFCSASRCRIPRRPCVCVPPDRNRPAISASSTDSRRRWNGSWIFPRELSVSNFHRGFPPCWLCRDRRGWFPSRCAATLRFPLSARRCRRRRSPETARLANR